MSAIHVCPLSRLAETLRASGAASVVGLLGRADSRPALPDPVSRRLALDLSDITVPVAGHVLATRAHVDSLLRFVLDWDRGAPLLIHCYAGVSRSTAAAFAALCALDPATPETTHAATLRAASPTATPNALIVALADDVLGRAGRMNAAIGSIGRGVACFEGNVFHLPVRRARGAG